MVPWYLDFIYSYILMTEFILCVVHRSTCMQRGMDGPSPCSCSSHSYVSPWITSLPGHYNAVHSLLTHKSLRFTVTDCGFEYGFDTCSEMIWYLPVLFPMMHCSQRLEDSVEHRTWSLWARGEKSLSLLSSLFQHYRFWLYLCLEHLVFGTMCRWLTGITVFQEPPKEDLTVSEKFQLVLDVAQKAQVRLGRESEVRFHPTSLKEFPSSHFYLFIYSFLVAESVWKAG